MNFLPAEYKIPKGASSYLKFEKGDTKVRMLSAPIVGWEDWDLNRKPVRYRYVEGQKPPAVINAADPKAKVKPLWAIIVWDYDDSSIKILSITQKRVMKAIDGLTKDSDWGMPYFYDIKVKREGDGTSTEYTVLPCNKSATPKMIQDAFYAKRCRVDAIMDNQDPFAEWPKCTPGVFTLSAEPENLSSHSISANKALRELLDQCDATFQRNVLAYCAKSGIKEDFENLTDAKYDTLSKSINQNYQVNAKITAAIGE